MIQYAAPQQLCDTFWSIFSSINASGSINTGAGSRDTAPLCLLGVLFGLECQGKHDKWPPEETRPVSSDKNRSGSTFSRAEVPRSVPAVIVSVYVSGCCAAAEPQNDW